MDEHSHNSPLDSHLAAFVPESACSDMEFPAALATSLRTRRIHRRVKAAIAVTVPVLLVAVTLSFWPRPTSVQREMILTRIVRDPASLPAETNWQPARLERAGGANRLNALDF